MIRETGTTAETLRQAAALMRKRGQAARPSPWQVDAEWWHDDDELGGMDSTNLVTAGEERKPVAVTAPRDLNDQHNRNADMAHVASWHPAVALAVADLVECPCPDHAAALARAYLEDRP